MKSLFSSLKVMSKVIYALMMREIITRYGRKNIGFLWIFAEPLILIIGVTIIWSYFRPMAAEGFPIQAFIFTGWVANKLWILTVGRTMAGINANLKLLYHRNIKPMDILLSRIFLEITAITGVFILLGFVFAMSHIIDIPYDFFYIVVGWYLMAWFAFGLAFLIASVNILTENLFQRIWSPLSLGLFIASGTFFLVEWLPVDVRPYFLLLPTIHNLEMIRYGFFGNVMHPYFDILYSVMCNIFIMFFGLLTFKLTERKILAE